MAAVSPSITATIVSGRGSFRSRAYNVAVSVAAADTYVLTINHGLPTTPDEVRPILRSVTAQGISISSRPAMILANATIVQFAIAQGARVEDLYDFVCEVTPSIVA